MYPLSTPSCLSYINAGQTHLHNGRAAELREEEKINKYGFLPKSEGFTPFVVEATGRLGNRAKAFLSVMISKDETFLLSQFYNALSSLVTLFNSLMLKKAFLKLPSLETNVFWGQ